MQTFEKSSRFWVIANVPLQRIADKKYFKTKKSALKYLDTGELTQVSFTNKWGFYKFERYPVYG